MKKVSTNYLQGEKKKKQIVDATIRKLEKFCARHPWAARVYIKVFEKMTIDEFAMVDLPRDTLILDIGCGSLPHSFISLAQARGWRFHGIDIDPMAVKNAQQIIQRLGFEDVITVEHADGLTYDISNFDFIVMSHGVEPKQKILEKLGKEMKPSARLLYRTITEKLTKVYGEEPIPDTLEIKKEYDRVDGIRALLLASRRKQ
jgi:2-polyprenyl-3-methyl-5-hydroxy-6-metoxy-1,4-benzoquinol methylase